MDSIRNRPYSRKNINATLQRGFFCVLLLALTVFTQPAAARFNAQTGQGQGQPQARGPFAPLHGCGGNLLVNADFELGAAVTPFAFAGGTAVIMDASNGPTSWTKATTLGNNYWVNNTLANSGTHFLYTFSNGTTEGANEACNQQVFTTPVLCPNTTYTLCVFAADAKADGNPSGLSIEVQEQRSTGANSRPLHFNRYTLPNNPDWSDTDESLIPWTQYCYTFTTHSLTDRAVISLSASSLDGGATTSYIVIDDVCLPGVSPCTEPTPKTDLHISKSVLPTLYNLGVATNVTYTVQVTNHGPANVVAAPVTDNAPTNVTFNSWTCAITTTGTGLGANACGAASGTGNINSTVSLKLFAAATYTINATISAAATGTITNTVNEQLPPAGIAQDPAINRTDTANAAVGPNGPLAVRLSGLTAQAMSTGGGNLKTAGGPGVTINWRTGFEVGNLGFNVYRVEGGQRVRVNPTLLAGSSLMTGARTPLTAGNAYAYSDARGSAGTGYWLEALDLDGTSVWHGPIYATVASGGESGGIQPQRAQTLEELNGAANKSAQREYANAGAATPLLLLAGDSPAAPATWTLPNERAAKLLVRKTGWYRVTAAELQAAGFDTNVNPVFLQLFADGVEVPLKAGGKGNSLDFIEFYGRGLDSDTRVYWLTAGQQSNRRIEAQAAQTPSFFSSTSFLSTVERKDRLIYFSGLLNGDAENWFGPVINAAGVTQKLTTHAVNRRGLQSAWLEIVLQGVTEQAHVVNVELNGRFIGTLNFTGKKRQLASFPVLLDALRDGENDLRLSATAGASDISLTESLRLTYPRGFVANGDTLQFNLVAGQSAYIGGFSTPNIRLLELGAQSGQVRELHVKAQGLPGDYGFPLHSPAGATYLALADTRLERVAGVKLNLPSNWRATINAADFVIVTHRDFWTAANRLAAARRANGLRVAVVDVEDAYDEFAYGARAPQAVKDLLSYARANWARKPGFALLIGDATNDPNNYLGTDDNEFIPAKLGATFNFETALDNWFADANGDGLPELALGRLPVRSAAQADAVVGKILAFKVSAIPRGGLFVSDRTVDGVNFKAISEQLASLLPPLMTKQFINRTDGQPEQLRTQIVNSINLAKPLVVNWLGHGSTQVWTGDGLLRTQDVAALSNSAAGLFVMTTCLNGYFTDPQQQSLGEAVLLNPLGGAFGVITSTGLNQPEPQRAFNLALYQNLFGKGLTLGEALTAARAATHDQDVRNTYLLFGDPTMTISPRR